MIAAAAVTVVALTAVGYAHRRSGGPLTSPNQPARTSITSTALDPTTAQRRAAAIAEAARLLGAVTLPAGAKQVAALPTSVLHPVGIPMLAGPVTVTRSGWWTAPGSMSGVLAYLSAHQRRGFTRSFTQSGTFTGVGFDVTQATSWLQATVTYSVATLPNGAVGIRADAQVGYNPQRPAWSLLSDITSITGILHGQNSTTTHTTTDAAVIAGIVHRLNAGPLMIYGATNCPAIMWTGNLTLRSGTRTAATVEVSVCLGPALTVPGHGTISVGVDYSIFKAVLPVPTRS